MENPYLSDYLLRMGKRRNSMYPMLKNNCLFVTSLCWYEFIVKVLQLARRYSGGEEHPLATTTVTVALRGYVGIM